MGHFPFIRFLTGFVQQKVNSSMEAAAGGREKGVMV